MTNAIVTSHEVGDVTVISTSAERKTGAAQTTEDAVSTHRAIDPLRRQT
jgi:hypothetical protein